LIFLVWRETIPILTPIPLTFFIFEGTETMKLLVEVVQADDNEDIAVNNMSDEDAERMLQKLISEANTSNGNL